MSWVSEPIERKIGWVRNSVVRWRSVVQAGAAIAASPNAPSPAASKDASSIVSVAPSAPSTAFASATVCGSPKLTATVVESMRRMFTPASSAARTAASASGTVSATVSKNSASSPPASDVPSTETTAAAKEVASRWTRDAMRLRPTGPW